MTRALLLFPLLLLLAACVPGGGSYAPPAIDPHSRLALADNVQREAQAQIRATEQRLASLGEEAAVVSTRVAAEVVAAAEIVELKKTDVALDLELLRPTETYQAMMLSWYGQETAAAQLSPMRTATAQSLLVAMEIEELSVLREQQRLERDKIIMWVGGISVVLLSLAISISIVLYARQQVENQEIQAYVIESRSGPVVFNRSRWMHELLEAPRRQELTQLRQAPPMLEVHNSYAVSSPDPKPNKSMELVRELFDKAIEIEGEEGRKIPSWREMKITSDRWQRAKKLAENLGLVVSQPGVGTSIAEPYADLAEVGYALDMRQFPTLSPTPPRDA